MNKTILLVEDDAFVRDLYFTVLSKAGYTVEIANDGEEAVGMSGYKVYDLILLDIMLPKLTGMEVLKALRSPESRAKDTPVYLLTNLGEENIIQEAYRLGANGYLLKAKYLPKQLVEEVDKFFSKAPDEEALMTGEEMSTPTSAPPKQVVPPAPKAVEPKAQDPVVEDSTDVPPTVDTPDVPQKS